MTPAFRYTIEDVKARAQRMELVFAANQHTALRPGGAKVPPEYNQTMVAERIGLSRGAFQHGVTKKKFPQGIRKPGKTIYTMEMVREVARKANLRHLSAEGHGLFLTVANVKGGVAKTSTALSFAQFMAMRAYNVLVIDLDPQGSASTLFGISPYLDVEDNNSASAIFSENPVDPFSLIRNTYWPGLDVIPANQILYQREFGLAAAAPEYGGEIFEIMRQRIHPLRSKYDLVIIDTQPAFGFLTASAIFCADHLLVTVPPSSIDFASTVMLWRLMGEVMEQAAEAGGTPMSWRGIHILQTIINERHADTELVRQNLMEGCGSWLLPEGIPETTVVTNASAEFKTVYDIDRYEGSSRSIRRARDAFDRAYRQIEKILEKSWCEIAAESTTTTDQPDRVEQTEV